MNISKSCAIVLLISLLWSSSPVLASQPTFTTLHPGQFQYIDQNLQINIVFVGYHPGAGPRDAVAELGQETATVMGYPWLNFDFSQFDRDNMNRNLTAAYLNQANAVLAKILASPTSREVNELLVAADLQGAAVLNIYQTMDYANAASYAKDAYAKVLAAAAQINVPVEQQAAPADSRAHGANYMLSDDFTVGRRR